MGRVLETHIVGIACEKRSCPVVTPLPPRTPNGQWWHLVELLAPMVDGGWVMLTGASRLRAYCPTHAEDATRCTCVSSGTSKTCVVHTPALAAEVWTKDHAPEFLAVLEGVKQ